MNIRKAEASDLETVKNITADTINKIYPRYYPKGAVDFFLSHHNTDNIKKDIISGNVYILTDGGISVGTVTAKGNEICRLFVLPQFQGKGHGGELLGFAEDIISRSFNEIVLDCSLPAKGIYLKKGYSFIRAESIETDNGDCLCYDVMGKKVRKKLPENIFPMTAEDHREVYRLWTNTKGMGLNDIDDSYEGIKRFLERNPSTCFIARENGRVIGAVICGNDGRRGYIYHTAVDENHRNKGIATALVDSAVNALSELGIAKTALVVFKKNELGNAFWEKKGFTVRDDIVYRNKALAEMKRIDT